MMNLLIKVLSLFILFGPIELKAQLPRDQIWGAVSFGIPTTNLSKSSFASSSSNVLSFINNKSIQLGVKKDLLFAPIAISMDFQHSSYLGVVPIYSPFEIVPERVDTYFLNFNRSQLKLGMETFVSNKKKNNYIFFGAQLASNLFIRDSKQFGTPYITVSKNNFVAYDLSVELFNKNTSDTKWLFDRALKLPRFEFYIGYETKIKFTHNLKLELRFSRRDSNLFLSWGKLLHFSKRCSVANP